MLKSKKQIEEADKAAKAKADLLQELVNVNGQGAGAAGACRDPAAVCETKYPMELARKLAKKFPGAEFTVAVPGDGYDNQDYEIRARPVWTDEKPHDAGSEYAIREAVGRAKKQLKQICDFPPIESLKLYAQGAADALADVAKLRKEIDELRKSSSEDRGSFPFHPAMMFHPFFSRR